MTQLRNRLHLAEPSLALEYGSESLEERAVILVLQLGGSRDILLQRLVMRVNRVELPPALGIREDVHCLLNTFEKCVVVGLAGNGRLFIGVVFEHFLPV